MPTDQMMSKLGKHWDIPAQCKFNDVIRRSGDLIFFPKSNILCDLQSHIPQIYIYVLMIHTGKGVLSEQEHFPSGASGQSSLEYKCAYLCKYIRKYPWIMIQLKYS